MGLFLAIKGTFLSHLKLDKFLANVAIAVFGAVELTAFIAAPNVVVLLFGNVAFIAFVGIVPLDPFIGLVEFVATIKFVTLVEFIAFVALLVALFVVALLTFAVLVGTFVLITPGTNAIVPITAGNNTIEDANNPDLFAEHSEIKYSYQTLSMNLIKIPYAGLLERQNPYQR